MGSFQQEGKRSFCSTPKPHKLEGSRGLGTVCFKGFSGGCILPQILESTPAISSQALCAYFILLYFGWCLPEHLQGLPLPACIM